MRRASIVVTREGPLIGPYTRYCCCACSLARSQPMQRTSLAALAQIQLYGCPRSLCSLHGHSSSLAARPQLQHPSSHAALARALTSPTVARPRPHLRHKAAVTHSGPYGPSFVLTSLPVLTHPSTLSNLPLPNILYSTNLVLSSSTCSVVALSLLSLLT